MNSSEQEQSNSENTARHLQDVLDVLAGKRVPFEPDASQLLYYMLAGTARRDVYIGREGFFLLNKAKLSPCPVSLAAPVVSQLLTWAGVEEATDRIRAVIGPQTVYALRNFLTGSREWSFERRLIWLDATPEHVKIYIRNGSRATARTLKRLPAPLPQPVCPYCGSMLRNFQAKQCRYCKRDWHDPQIIRWLGDNQRTP
jgi:hypothetical protein